MYIAELIYPGTGLDHKLLGVLAATPHVPPAVGEAKNDLAAALPALRGVRNSVAHHEDRSRGRGREGKPLALKPIDNWSPSLATGLPQLWLMGETARLKSANRA